jgi:hypothetical protein
MPQAHQQHSGADLDGWVMKKVLRGKNLATQNLVVEYLCFFGGDLAPPHVC